MGLEHEEGIENLQPWKPLSIVSVACFYKVRGAIIAPASEGFSSIIFLSGFLIHCDLLLSFELMQDIFSDISDLKKKKKADSIRTYFNEYI